MLMIVDELSCMPTPSDETR